MHHLKVALRNLWKYRTQNIISILGLAAGFICFALSALWIRYELTYDNFHDGAERIYYVRMKPFDDQTAPGSVTPYQLSGYLETHFPEIERACYLKSWDEEVEIEGSKSMIHLLVVDSSFFKTFDVKLIAGSLDFVQPGSGKIALTESYARKLFPDGQALGKKIKMDEEDEYEVRAIVSGWSGHSSIPYDLLCAPSQSSMEQHWGSYQWYTFAKLKPRIDKEAFITRLQKTTLRPNEYTEDQIVLTPLTEKRHDQPQREDVGYIDLMKLRLFLWAGALLIVAALLNYWGVFSSLLRIRHREIALRLVNGSSWWKVWKLLCTDVLLLQGIAMGISMVGIELFMPTLIKLAQIESSRLDIYIETFLYIAAVVLIALVFLSISVYYLQRNSLYHTLSRKTSERYGKDYFRKSCLLLQLVISLGFIFCTSVMLKQVYYLKHTDIGILRENRATLRIEKGHLEPVFDRIKQLPQIVRMVDKGTPLFPSCVRRKKTLEDWKGKPESVRTPLYVHLVEMSHEMFDFYGIHLIEGEMPEIIPNDPSALINETMARQLQVEQPIGLEIPQLGIVVRGIVPDFHLHPTLPPMPMVFDMPNTKRYNGHAEIMVEYRGSWEELDKNIVQIVETLYPGKYVHDVVEGSYADNIFEDYLESEQRLINLLSIVSAACILISIFGVYSLTALQCEQRRKEIAIRKVNGAKTGDILRMFFREYVGILLIAAAIAFPIGTILMKQWLEQYTLQTALSPWVYLCILVVVAAALYGSMAWRVGRTARKNPAEVIKSN